MITKPNLFFPENFRVGYINPHASNSPFFTALLMYFTILSLCHTWDYGLTYQSLNGWYQRWDVYQDMHTLGDWGVLLLGVYLVFCFINFIQYNYEKEAVSSQTKVYQKFLPFVNEASTFSEVEMEMLGGYAEYSEALIQYYTQNQLPFQPSSIVHHVSEEEAYMRAEQFFFLCIFIWGLLIGWEYYFSDFFFKDAEALSPMIAFSQTWGLQMFASLDVLVYEALNWYYFSAYSVDISTIRDYEMWGTIPFQLDPAFSFVESFITLDWPIFWGLLDHYFCLNDWVAKDAKTIYEVFQPPLFFETLQPFDVFWHLTSPEKAQEILALTTTLFGSKLFFLFLMSLFCFIMGTYNWIYVLSMSDDSFMNKELNRIGHFSTEKNVWFGFKLFLLSEVLIFAGFFWALFFYMLVPSVAIGSCWPPYGIPVVDAMGVPLLNTALLIASGVAITCFHHEYNALKKLLKRAPYLTSNY